MAAPQTGPKTRAVHVADLITVYTGTVCTVDGSLDGVKRMLEFMVNRQLKIVQLNRAANTVMLALAQQFPWLPVLTPPDTAGRAAREMRDTVAAWVNQAAAEHGLVHWVQRLAGGIWEDKDPVQEYRSLLAPAATVSAAGQTGDPIETFTNPAPDLSCHPPVDEGDS